MPSPSSCAALDFEAFCHAAAVSRETGERLEAYFVLLQKWQRKINLVGPASLEDPWRRHFLDSAQLHPLIHAAAVEGAGGAGKNQAADAPVLVDLGSGAGFPGLVLAVLGGLTVHLIESNARKCAFLREAARVTESAVSIHNARIESLDPADILGPGLADCVTGRACAPLDRLLGLAKPFLSRNGFALFLKGAGVTAELTRARKSWNITCERLPSITGTGGAVLKIREIRAHGS